jgi:uncharacterized RDD family membrane protein YckC
METDDTLLPGAPDSITEKEEWNRFQEGSSLATPHPWLRFFARMIDVQLWAILVFTVLAAFQPLLPKIPNWVTGMIALFLYNFVEATAFALYGTTTGKWFLRIEVRSATGDTLGFGRALGRVFSIWIRGMGLGIPLVNLFAMAACHGRLKSRGITEWDREGRFRVIHGTLGTGRRIMLVLLVVLCFGLCIAGTIIQRKASGG